jgi:hypothetical protein
MAWKGWPFSIERFAGDRFEQAASQNNSCLENSLM